MEMIWVLVGFFAFMTLAFIAIAYFLPEWIGITGQKALEIEKHQRGDSPSEITEKPGHANDTVATIANKKT